jgi:hypothetical protein
LITAKSVNALAWAAADYFMASARDERFDQPWPIIFSQTEMSGLSRRVQSVEEACLLRIRERMSRVAKLAVRHPAATLKRADLSPSLETTNGGVAVVRYPALKVENRWADVNRALVADVVAKAGGLALNPFPTSKYRWDNVSSADAAEALRRQPWFFESEFVVACDEASGIHYVRHDPQRAKGRKTAKTNREADHKARAEANRKEAAERNYPYKAWQAAGEATTALYLTLPLLRAAGCEPGHFDCYTRRETHPHPAVLFWRVVAVHEFHARKHAWRAEPAEIGERGVEIADEVQRHGLNALLHADQRHRDVLRAGDDRADVADVALDLFRVDRKHLAVGRGGRLREGGAGYIGPAGRTVGRVLNLAVERAGAGAVVLDDGDAALIVEQIDGAAGDRAGLRCGSRERQAGCA